MRKAIPVTAAVLALSAAPVALAASNFLKVSPGSVKAGKTVTITGSVGSGCQTGHQGDAAMIYSAAFKGATKTQFAGVPAVSVPLSSSKDGSFTAKLTLSKKVKKGTYKVGGRCGGGNFGSTKLKVTKPSSGPGGGFY